MTAAPPPETMVPRRYRIPLLLLLVALGLAGNHFRFPLFPDIDVLFGGIFAMLALQLLGVWPGTLAAALIASYSYLLWNHPYAIVIMTVEVLVVGLLMRHRRIELVLADTLYWVFVGIPLVWLCYHGVMRVPLGGVWIILAKQSVNGIANALLARLLFTKLLLRYKFAKVTYHDAVYNLLAAFVLFPALILICFSSKSDFAATDRNIRALLLHESRQVASVLDTWIGSGTSAAMRLAELAAVRTPRQMQPDLELMRSSGSHFLSIGLWDGSGTVTAHSPPRDADGTDPVGRNRAGSPFYPGFKMNPRPLLTEMVTGGGKGRSPFVALLAPVKVGGEFRGHVTGILNLGELRKVIAAAVDQDGMVFTLVDRNGNVIMTSRNDQAVLKPFVRPEGSLSHLDTAIERWLPAGAATTPASERWKDSVYIREVPIGVLSEWRLILEQPVAPYQKRLVDDYTVKLVLLLVLLLAALVLAEFISRWIISSLMKLNSLTSELPLRVAAEGGGISWPSSSVKEASDLIENFRNVADSLSVQFYQVKLLNDSLEQRVKERTRALEESENFTTSVLDSLTSNIAVLDEDGIIVLVNEPWNSFARENSLPGTAPVYLGLDYLSACGEAEGQEDPVSRAARSGIAELLQGKRDDFSLEYPCHSPDLQRWFQMTASRLRGARSGVVVSHTDVTGRRLAEEALRENRALLHSIINGTSDAVYVKDGEGRYQLLNSAAERILGRRAEQALGQDDYALFPLQQAETIRKNDRAALEAGKVGTYEAVLTNWAGVQRTFHSTKGPLYDSRGNLAGVFGISRDITELKELEDELRLALAAAEQANSTMKRLLDTVAHEFRTPLGLLTCSTDILDRYWDRLTPEQRFEQNRHIRSAARQLASLVQSVVLFNSPDPESHPDEQVLLGIEAFCRRVAREVETVWSSGQRFEILIGEECGSSLLDELHFRRVLENLLTNAFRYTPAQGSITLRVRREDGMLLTEVCDTGIGIPEDEVAHIFDSFYRSTNVEGRRGLGLGLSIVQESLQQLRGTIAVSSRLGVGSTMQVEIPLGQEG